MNSVATLGTAFSAEHLKLLSRYAEKLYVMYDGDSAGQRATLKLAELCWNANRDILFVKMPQNDDPASLLVRENNFDLLLEGAQDIFLFFIQEFTQDFFSKTLHERLSLLTKLLEGIGKIEEPLKRDLLLHKASLRCHISPETLTDALNIIVKKNDQKLLQAQSGAGIRTQRQDARLVPGGVSALEKRLFCVILQKDVPLREGEREELKKFLPEHIQKLATECERVGTLSLLTDEEQDEAASMLVEAEVARSSEVSDDYQSILDYFRKKLWTRQVQELAFRLKQAQQENNTEEIGQLLAQFELLKKKNIMLGK